MTSTPPPSQPFQPFHHDLNEKQEEELGPDDSISMVSTSVSGGNSNNSNSTSRRRLYADALKTPTSSSFSSSSSATASVPASKPKPKGKSKSATNRRRSNNKTSPTNTNTNTDNDNDNNVPYITRHCTPGPGSIYIIVHKSGNGDGRNKALAVVEGHLSLATPPEVLPNPPRFDSVEARTTTFAGTCNWHWHCEQSDGWLGFRNAATGLWLGLHKGVVEGGGAGGGANGADGGIKAGMLDATGLSLGVNEQFCVRKAAAEDENDEGEEGGEGYVLLKRVDVKNPGFWFPGRSVHLWPTVGLTVINLKVTGVDRKQMTWEFVRVDHDAVFEGRMDGRSL